MILGFYIILTVVFRDFRNDYVTVPYMVPNNFIGLVHGVPLNFVTLKGSSCFYDVLHALSFINPAFLPCPLHPVAVRSPTL